MSSNVTLKPCPFCGGEPALHSYLLEASVVCPRCGAEMSADHGAKLDDKTGDQLAIAAWNQRADAQVERAAVVAFLSGNATLAQFHWGAPLIAAIEAGEHLQKEGVLPDE